jgi:hypothetical protein
VKFDFVNALAQLVTLVAQFFGDGAAVGPRCKAKQCRVNRAPEIASK